MADHSSSTYANLEPGFGRGTMKENFGSGSIATGDTITTTFSTIASVQLTCETTADLTSFTVANGVVTLTMSATAVVHWRIVGQ